MLYRPIVVLVPDELMGTLDEIAAEFEPSPEMDQLCQRNGWHVEMLVWGALLRAAATAEAES